MKKYNSPYSASITGCGFLLNEFERVLPLMMDPDGDRLLKEEVENNQLLQVNSLNSRKRFVAEFKRRYQALPYIFWQAWQGWSDLGKRAGLFYAILKTYKLIFDFHFNIAIRHWNSIDHSLSKSDILMEFNEIASHDEFVDSWSETTKDRCASQYITILHQTGLLTDKTNQLQPIHPDIEELAYYFHSGEEWFLEALMLYPYEINDIKSKL